MIDLFANDKFPDFISKQNVLDAMPLLYKNITPTCGKDDAEFARLMILMETTVVSGTYDGKCLFVVSGKDNIFDLMDLLDSALNVHNVDYIETDTGVVLVKKNAIIEFATYPDLINDNYEFFDGDTVIASLNYNVESKQSMIAIEPKLKKALGLAGKLYGFVDDVNDFIPQGNTLASVVTGQMRGNDVTGKIEVYTGTQWKQLQP